jgi:HEAT repeat protein
VRNLCSCGGWLILSHEPSVEGRSLSAWLTDLKDVREERSASARFALQKLGSNAVPYLLKRLQRKEGFVERFADSVFGQLSRGRPFQSRISERRLEAGLAFDVLGTNAISAFPQLCFQLTNYSTANDEIILAAAATALAAIGETSRPFLISELANSNHNIRRAAILGLSDATSFKEEIQAIQRAVSDVDAEVRLGALSILFRNLDDQTEKKVLLKNALDDPDPTVRSFAKSGLLRLDREEKK